MNIKGEKMNQRVMRLTHKKPVTCRCRQCRTQCEGAPCLGTPLDIKKLIDNGYTDRLEVSLNYGGMLVGAIDHPVRLVTAKTPEGKCIFFTSERLCELHDLGLKPLEGRLSHHSTTAANFRPGRSIAVNIMREWENPDNAELVTDIFSNFPNNQ